MSARKALRPVHPLKRRTKPRKSEPVDPKDYATKAEPIGMCRECKHHTSAWVAGGCTVMIWPEGGALVYCGCNCRKHLGPLPKAERSDPEGEQ